MSSSKAFESLADGQVRFIFENGAVYVGESNNMIREGFGKQTWPDGFVYEGYWKHDMPNGKGAIVQADGGRF